jgi:site-specific DNA-methyltransferase (adenine-specific)
VIYDTPATDAAKLWDGYGTALKPAWEPIILAMKPLDGTFAENALKHGVAGLHIAAGRISAQEGDDGVCRARKTGSTDTVGDFGFHRADSDAHNAPGTAGRWPANVLLDEEAAAILDEQSGQSCYPAHKTKRSATGKEEQYCGNFAGQSNVTVGHGDSGGASRFFYISKADSAERNASGPNNHPTIKPVDLCAYLAKLILPNRGDARLIVPFSGSGSEIMGALRAGWAECVGIEKESEYVDLSCRRITEDAPMFNVEIGDPLHRLTDAELAVLGAQDEAKKLALERDVE